eukprot:Tbor_TRINITY_DN5976_c1_g2::TRINITY_DN5976_c1_g2_i2::g.19485::m.19485
MCKWEKRGESVEILHDYWMTVKDRMYHIGPILRYIFNEDKYNTRKYDINVVLRTITRKNVMEYYDIERDKLWISKNPSHKITKITRLIFERNEYFYNKPICPEVIEKILDAVSSTKKDNITEMSILLPLHELIPRVLEKVGVRAFMKPHFVERIHNRLTELRQNEMRGPGKKWVLHNNFKLCPRKKCIMAQRTKGKKGNTLPYSNVKVEFHVLYVPNSVNFPVLDGFFFVDRPKTIVGIQTTLSCTHHTNTSKVKVLLDNLSCFFVDWEEFSKDLSWEIVYVQHLDSKT